MLTRNKSDFPLSKETDYDSFLASTLEFMQLPNISHLCSIFHPRHFIKKPKTNQPNTTNKTK